MVITIITTTNTIIITDFTIIEDDQAQDEIINSNVINHQTVVINVKSFSFNLYFNWCFVITIIIQYSAQQFAINFLNYL